SAIYDAGSKPKGAHVFPVLPPMISRGLLPIDRAEVEIQGCAVRTKGNSASLAGAQGTPCNGFQLPASSFQQGMFLIGR
ncbi:hypothetical protein DNK01_18785, partial [Stutzerimonas kirkiae]